MTRDFAIVAATALSCAAGTPALGSFHLIQIEQVIGGVNGQTDLQAVQLTMRGVAPQNELGPTRLRVFDAAGENPLVLHDFTGDVPNGGMGVRVLVASPGFAAALDTPIDVDATMETLIPESYLEAGSLTFEDDTGAVLWRLSWGGDDYTGPTDGLPINDPDGEFGPPYDGPLPSDGVEALSFTGGPADPSSGNADDYELTDDASTWTNNEEESGTLVENASVPGDINGDGTVDVVDLALLLLNWGSCDGPPDPCHPADLNGDGSIDVEDFALVILYWG